jgi:hypothetical protein
LARILDTAIVFSAFVEYNGSMEVTRKRELRALTATEAVLCARIAPEALLLNATMILSGAYFTSGCLASDDRTDAQAYEAARQIIMKRNRVRTAGFTYQASPFTSSLFHYIPQATQKHGYYIQQRILTLTLLVLYKHINLHFRPLNGRQKK